MATFTENLKQEAKRGIASSIENSTGIIGQAMRDRRIREEKQRNIQSQVQTIQQTTGKLKSVNAALSSIETSFIQMSANFRLIAKAMDAQVTLQEETDKLRQEENKLRKQTFDISKEKTPAQQSQIKRIEKSIAIEQKKDESIFSKLSDLIDGFEKRSKAGRTGRGGRIGGRFSKFGKLAGRLAGKVLGPLALAEGIYESKKFLDETKYGERMAQGEGKVAEKAFRERNTDFSDQPLTPQQAQDILDSNSKRDIKAFGGRERLERIAGTSKPVAAPPIQTTLPSTGAGGGRGVVNPASVTPTAEPAAAPSVLMSQYGTVTSGSGQAVTTGTAAATKPAAPVAPPPSPPPPPPPTAAAKPSAAATTAATTTEKPPAGGNAIELLNTAMGIFKITNPFAKGAILANVEKESEFVPQNENLRLYANTSNERIRKVFTDRVTKYSDAELDKIKKDPVLFGELVYGKDTQVGQEFNNTQDGDGYKYRGRGFIQITGKKNYAFYGKMIGEDLVGNPDKANEPWTAARVAAAYITTALRGKLDFSSQSEANRAVTQAIGGKRLNLDKGIGAEILGKVEKYSGKYINEASIAVAAAKQDQQQQKGNATVVAVNNTRVIKKPPQAVAMKESSTPVAG